MADDQMPKEEREARTANVLVFRNSVGDPIAVPDEVVTEAERAYRCYKLRVSGMSWETIAEKEKYPSAGSAKYDVDRYMAEARSLVVDASAREVLTLEVHRLDELQHSLWPAAMSGHVPSAALVMNIVVNRAKLLGLYDDVRDVSNTGRTVVVPMDDDGYLASLQAAAEADAPAAK